MSSTVSEDIVVTEEVQVKEGIPNAHSDDSIATANSSSSSSSAEKADENSKTYPVRVVPLVKPSKPEVSQPEDATKDDFGLVAACEKGSLKAVKFLLEKYSDYYSDINKVYAGQYGTTTTPLIRAAESGRLPVVQYLLEERNAMINQQDSSGYTAVMKACFSGHLPVTQYLVEKGADIHMTNFTHGSTAVFYAAISGEVQLVQFLVSKGADIHMQNGDGDTPLIKAADFGNVAVVHYLIKQGVDVLVENSRGKNALKVARVKEIKNSLQAKMDEIHQKRQKELQLQHLAKKRKREEEEQKRQEQLRLVKQKQAISEDPLSSLAEVAALLSTKNAANKAVAQMPPVLSNNTVAPAPNTASASNLQMHQFAVPSSSSSSNMQDLFNQMFNPSSTSHSIVPQNNGVDWKQLYEQELMNRLRCELRLTNIKEEVTRLQQVLTNIQYMQLIAAKNHTASFMQVAMSKQTDDKKHQ